MQTLTKVAKRSYIAAPGTSFPLPDGMTDPGNRQNQNCHFAKFPAPLCTYTTEYKEIQDAIEKYQGFGKEIRRVPTREELKEQQEIQKVGEFIEKKKEEIETLGVENVLPNESIDYKALQNYAKFLRLSPVGKKVEILTAIYDLFGLEFKSKEKGT
jgi:hypothetical protein